MRERELIKRQSLTFWQIKRTKSGAPNDGLLLHKSKTLFRLPRVLLDLQKCILSGAIKFGSVLSSQGNLSLFEIISLRAPVFFPENFRSNSTFYENESFCNSSLHPILSLKTLGFLFTKKNSLASLTWGVKCEKLNFRKSQRICIGDSMICSDIWHKYYE